MDTQQQQKESIILECEKMWIFMLLMAVGGYLGAFTYLQRGGVFCNAQTANLLLLSLSLGKGNWSSALYYLIPFCAYYVGTMLSEYLPKRVRRLHFLRWDSLLLGFELLVVLLLGFIPDAWPFQISQVAVNFICSMQYNTFRQAEHIPMATTFCTNHLRQSAVFLTKWLRHREHPEHWQRSLRHAMMLLAFIAGCISATLLCSIFGSRAIWGAGVMLLIAFIDLAHADLTIERELMDIKPAGH